MTYHQENLQILNYLLAADLSSQLYMIYKTLPMMYIVNQRELTSDLDPTKQTQVIFSCKKSTKAFHSPLLFNNITAQKHLSILLDTHLTCDDHIKEIIKKINKTLALLRYL